jgi:hypothetical protein
MTSTEFSQRLTRIAMYLPGFITARLIQRMGPHAIITAGGLLTLCCVAGNLAFGSAFSAFTVALMLLGVGWNFMFIGGTTRLTAAHDPHECVHGQATNDFIVFGTVACTALASGAIEAGAGLTPASPAR